MFNIFKRSKPDESEALNPSIGSNTSPADSVQVPPAEDPQQPISPGQPTPGSPAQAVPTAPDGPVPGEPEGGLAAGPSLAQTEPPVTAEPRKSLLYYLFSPELSFGRFFRVALRWLGTITGLFALGLLAGYLLLYQPTQQELDASQVRLGLATEAAAQQFKNQQSAQLDRDQALKALQQQEVEVKKAASQNSLLIVLVDVQNARVALINKDGANAKVNIERAQANLAKVLPYLRAQDSARSDVLQPRLDLAARELVSDPAAAQSDLDKLAADLSDLHKRLFLP